MILNFRTTVFILFLCLLSVNQVKSQQNNTSTLQIELLGAYNLAGVSFDQRFSSDYNGLGYKVGLGVGYSNQPWTFVPFKYTTFGGFPKQEIISLPLQINYLLGKGNNQFDVGAGITPFYSTFKFNAKSNVNAYGTFATGYRYHNLNNHLVFGVGVMIGFRLPGLDLQYVDKVFWQPYLSVGYVFNR